MLSAARALARGAISGGWRHRSIDIALTVFRWLTPRPAGATAARGRGSYPPHHSGERVSAVGASRVHRHRVRPFDCERSGGAGIASISILDGPDIVASVAHQLMR